MFSGDMGRGRPQNKHNNAEVKVQNDICTSIRIYKHTNIPDFQLCYP